MLKSKYFFYLSYLFLHISTNKIYEVFYIIVQKNNRFLYYFLDTYLPSFVDITTTSPSQINKGTFTSRPFSSVASLSAFVEVFPLTASVVYVTLYSTFSGKFKPISSDSKYTSSTSKFSFKYFFSFSIFFSLNSTC